MHSFFPDAPASVDPNRPPSLVKWIGSKGRMLELIYSLVPAHACWGDVFGGSFTVTIAKKRSPSELINDLDGDIVNFFSTLSDPKCFEELYHRIRYSVSSRVVFDAVVKDLKAGNYKDNIHRAWMFWYKCNCGLTIAPTAWRRTARFKPYIARSLDADLEPTNQWGGLPPQSRVRENLELTADRLFRVQLENRDTLVLIPEIDCETTFIYADPPYDNNVRTASYATDTTQDFHDKFVDTIGGIKGMGIVSGYDSPIYNRLESDYGWERVEYKTRMTTAPRSTEIAAPTRTEILWIKNTPGAR